MTAATVTNMLPSLSKSRASPASILLKRNPNTQMLKPFGCMAWILKPNQNRGPKLSEISWDGVFVGYANDLSSYQIARQEDLKVIITKHAVFDEELFPLLRPSVKSVDISSGLDYPIFGKDYPLPFNEERMVPAEEAHEESLLPRNAIPLPDSNNQYREIDPSALDGTTIEQPVIPTSRKLTIIGPRHPTLIPSNLLASNIRNLKRPRQQAVYAMSHLVEPRSHSEAMRSSESRNWMEAEKKEILEVWTERQRKHDDHPISTTWAYRRKLGAANNVVEYKARICAQGFRQTYGLNFQATYAPTGRPSSLRLFMAHAATCDLKIHQLDVCSAFLTCDLDEVVTLLPPSGYPAIPNTVFELKKAIYGLKQSPRVWYLRLSKFLNSRGFNTAKFDPCVFWRGGQAPTWIFIHVDDLAIFSHRPGLFKTEIMPSSTLSTLDPPNS